MILLEAYDITFRIYNHELQAQSPLDYIKMHPGEDYCQHSLLYARIREFARKRVGRVFNISLVEFLDLPRDICDYMIDVAVDQMNDESQTMEQLREDLEK